MALLTNRVALVTGASRGIGRAIAISLAEAGAAVAVNYLEKAAEARHVAQEIRDKGGRAVPAAADPVGTLTGQPNQYIPGLPPGSYPSPYYVDGPGCCGPLGRDGRIGYELYTFTGANFVFGPGLPAKLFTGWQVGGGARTLFFTPDHTAAWVIDLGLSYTHNGGRIDQPLNLFLRTNPVVNTTAGTLTLQPDRFVLTAIHGVHRESFNFNLVRDVWLWGAGNTGGETGTNVRVGGWVGGRYGSSHIDLLPLNDPSGALVGGSSYCARRDPGTARRTLT